VQRQSVGVTQQVVLRSGLACIGGVRAGQFTPFWPAPTPRRCSPATSPAAHGRTARRAPRGVPRPAAQLGWQIAPAAPGREDEQDPLQGAPVGDPRSLTRSASSRCRRISGASSAQSGHRPVAAAGHPRRHNRRRSTATCSSPGSDTPPCVMRPSLSTCGKWPPPGGRRPTGCRPTAPRPGYRPARQDRGSGRARLVRCRGSGARLVPQRAPATDHESAAQAGWASRPPTSRPTRLKQRARPSSSPATRTSWTSWTSST